LHNVNRKIFGLGKNLIKHELISGSLFIFVGFFISSILSFILNLFLVRSFTASDYGSYASLLSLFVLLGVPAQSLTTVIVRFATDYFAKNKLDESKTLYLRLLLFTTILSFFLFLGFVIFSVPISDFLHLDSSWYIILTGFIISVGYLGIANTAFLQSLLKFPLISFLAVIGGVLRTTIGVLLVFLGFKVFGALWAILAAFLFPFLYTFIPLRFLITRKKSKDIKFPTREIIGYAFPTSIAILSLNSFVTTDVILVKHFFNAHDAGLYGGLSLVGKAIFYFTGPVSSVMFPLLIKRHSLGQNFNSLFYLALIIVIIPSTAIVIFYFLFPSYSINFFLGGREYLKMSPYLGIYGFLIIIFSLLNVCVNFFLSLKKTGIFISVGLGAILQIILITLFHKTFFHVIGASLVSSVLVLITILIYYFKEYGSFRKIKETAAFINNLKY